MKILDNIHLIADPGKVIRRKLDGAICGEEIYLGLSFYKNGKLRPAPYIERPSDYEEINEPERDL